MKNRKKILLGILLVGLFVLSSCSNTTDKTANDTTDVQNILGEVFTAGEHDVSIMEITMSDEDTQIMNEISAKFNISIKKNSEWFNTYVVENSKPGEPLPYDEKFGLTEDEYNTIITSADRMNLTEKKKTKVNIIEEADGTLAIQSNEDLPYLSELKIDTKNNSFISTSGEFVYGNDIVASDDQKITGKWNGSAWTLDFEPIDDVNNIDVTKTYGSINISVGKLVDTQKTIVYYKENVIDQGKTFRGEEIIIIND